jgi:hypothetical protein
MSKRKIIDIAGDRNEFVTLDDGYVYYWPDKDHNGAMSSQNLRDLADELDRRNGAWNGLIEKELG